MRAVRSENTQPEMLVRRLLFREGYRYRLRGYRLPGKPDIIFPTIRKVIFVHGCFWHRHRGCQRATTPHRNEELWRKKFAATKVRDRKVVEELRDMGWRSLVIWECEATPQTRETLMRRLRTFLET